jgi:hypothetical protein
VTGSGCTLFLNRGRGKERTPLSAYDGRIKVGGGYVNCQRDTSRAPVMDAPIRVVACRVGPTFPICYGHGAPVLNHGHNFTPSLFLPQCLRSQNLENQANIR